MARSWDELAVGAAARLRFTVTEDDVSVFARLSGDRNPLHLDDAFARARRFQGRVVYGGLILAAVSSLLGTQLPGPGCVWHSLELKFLRPLYVGEHAEVAGVVTYANPEIKVVRLDVDILRAGERIAFGRVQAGIAAP